MKKYKREAIIIFGNLIALLIIFSEVKAQDAQGYIFGKVTTFDNQYQGQIRWGDEEAFWNDYFNANKIQNEFYESFKSKNKGSDDWTDFNWNLNSIWENKLNFTTHLFDCQFGDIQSIKEIGRSKFTLVLKNGNEIHLTDGSNDTGATLIVTDEELGVVKIRWERIEKVEFLPTPGNIKVVGGSPIYGKVETGRKGTFVGFIQWDHDERLGNDKLDGDDRDGDVSIPFKEIKYIEKDGDGSIVKLHSNREFYLTNSNDVDSDNRGIIVSIPGLGKVDIPWRYFRSVTFMKPPNSGPAYDDFGVPRGLRGTVYTIEDKEYSGMIVYDLDEAWEIETLNGNDDDIEYQIPFRHIKSIVPKNYDYSMVELRNSDRILLGGSRDVNEDNDGILIFERGRDKPRHIPWNNIAEVRFD